jgi:hypothetical protein
MRSMNIHTATSKISFLAILACCLAGWMAGTLDASAQAFCAIRNPNRIIQEFFDSGSVFRSYQRTISRDIAARCSQQVDVAFDPREFGKHTLYAVSEGETLVGYVMARTEVADYGLAEIAWKLDPQLRIQGFAFQRCRSPHRKALLESGLDQKLAGSTLEELIAMRQEARFENLMRSLSLKPEGEVLLRAVLNSAIKTILLTKVAFADDVG